MVNEYAWMRFVPAQALDGAVYGRGLELRLRRGLAVLAQADSAVVQDH